MNPSALQGMDSATLQQVRSRDAADVLRDFRSRFALPTRADGTPLVYLCGHSLGLMPHAARTALEQELHDWANLGVLGHEHAQRPWIPYHENLRAGLAALSGAQPGEVVAMNSLTVNLHLMLASFYRPSGRRTRILIEAGAFPSDRHAVASQLAWHAEDPHSALLELAPAPGSELVTEAQIEECLQRHGADIALVLWPGVQYRTGQAFDLERIVRAAHAAGALAGLDLAHSIGNMPLALHDSGADFAVWCSYKYLNAGPGAIGGCFIHERHLRQPPPVRLQGWWGHDVVSRFEMGPEFHAAAGADAWQISNPPVLAAAPLLASLQIFQEARLERLRAKALELTDFLRQCLEPLRPAVEIITPRAPAAHGCQLSVRIQGDAARGRRVFERLGALGVVCDWRAPDVIRLAAVPLYNSFEDVLVFSAILQQTLQEVS
ncbi:MAG: kynureninase [Sinobacteraceae bacterium]|nr:kynureninase [Nevskiaceae bacterium]